MSVPESINFNISIINVKIYDAISYLWACSYKCISRKFSTIINIKGALQIFRLISFLQEKLKEQYGERFEGGVNVRGQIWKLGWC